jgi:hypothetical protein
VDHLLPGGPCGTPGRGWICCNNDALRMRCRFVLPSPGNEAKQCQETRAFLRGTITLAGKALSMPWRGTCQHVEAQGVWACDGLTKAFTIKRIPESWLQLVPSAYGLCGGSGHLL